MSVEVDRIVREYFRATPGMVDSGHRWYPKAHELAVEMAEKHGRTLDVAAGVIAALSPRMPWGANIAMARKMLETDGAVRIGALGRSIRQAQHILIEEPPLSILRGPKTRAFYEAIRSAGASGEAVIDQHAWALINGNRDIRPLRPSEYPGAAQAMAEAAKELGVRTHDCQATTWIAWRARFRKVGTHDHHDHPTLEGAETWR